MQMELNTKEAGKMTSSMEKVQKLGQMELNMKAIIKMVKNMVKEF